MISPSSNNTVEEEEYNMTCIALTIKKFCEQEESHYTKFDWISSMSTSTSSRSSSIHYDVSDIEDDNDDDKDVNIVDWTTCRTSMIQWMEQMVTFLHMSHNTVEIAISLMDRFMMLMTAATAQTSFLQEQKQRWDYQLLSMTCLYTAIKIHEPICLNPTLLSKLSNQQYSVTDIETMECKILSVLHWHVNPPTTEAFIRLYMKLLQQSFTLLKSDGHNSTLHVSLLDGDGDEFLQTVQEAAIDDVRQVLSDCTFLPTKSSILAYCSVMNVLERLASNISIMDNSTDQSTNLFVLGQYLADHIGIDNCYDHRITDIQDNLYNYSSQINKNRKKITQKQRHDAHVQSKNHVNDCTSTCTKKKTKISSSSQSTVLLGSTTTTTTKRSKFPTSSSSIYNVDTTISTTTFNKPSHEHISPCHISNHVSLSVAM